MKNNGVFKWKRRKSFLKILIIPLFLVITFLVVYSFSLLAFAWVNPNVAPPGGNVDLDSCSTHLDFVCNCYPEDLPVGWLECSKKKIGEECGGGKVFYHDGSGGGLIAHPTDLSASQWGCRGKSVPTVSREFGTGLANTNAIVAFHSNGANFADGLPYYGCTSGSGGTCVAKGCNSSNNGTVAAKVCSDLSSGGYDDWYLPSGYEVAMLHMNSGIIGGFVTPAYYLSSSESTSATTTFAAVYFTPNSSGWAMDQGSKATPSALRCIRSF
jgi:hypothetical protein